jgi:hypothetical protein
MSSAILAVAYLAVLAGGAPDRDPPLAAFTSSLGKTYLAARALAVIPSDEGYSTTESWSWPELALGRRLTPNVALEIGVSRFMARHSDSNVTNAVGTQSWGEELDAVPIAASIVGIVPAANGRAELFGVVGVDVSFVSASHWDRWTTFDGSSGSTTTRGDDTPVGMHLGGGLGVHLARWLTAGFSLRWFTAAGDAGGRDVVLARTVAAASLALRR